MVERSQSERRQYQTVDCDCLWTLLNLHDRKHAYHIYQSTTLNSPLTVGVVPVSGAWGEKFFFLFLFLLPSLYHWSVLENFSPFCARDIRERVTIGRVWRIYIFYSLYGYRLADAVARRCLPHQLNVSTVLYLHMSMHMSAVCNTCR